jgi:gluconate:H+ symporter, GntP family
MTPLAILLIALVIVIGGVLAFRLHPFVILITAAFVVAWLTSTDEPISSVGQRVADGFGKTTVNVGIVIAMASILGSCLTAAGGAQRLVTSLQQVVGERHTPLALLLAGFVLGVPMYADTVFYLLVPLARAMWARTGRGYLLGVLAIVGGATMTHSLVPPTPGPLFVADAFAVDIATMITVGLIVGIVAAFSGFAFARFADHRWPLIPPEPAEPAEHDATAGDSDVSSGRMPPLWAAIVPILLPVVLISLESASRSTPEIFPADLRTVIQLVGEKNVALSLAALTSIVVLAGTGTSLPRVRATIASAVTEAGGIVLVIAAGGALGTTLRQAGLEHLAAGLGTGSGLALIPIAWLVTAVIRVAQGSATVAMITAAGVMAPLVLDGGPPFHPVYVAVAIGCGSKMGMWMNDSGFWVISRMSGMSETQTLRTASTMLSIEGTVGLLVTLALATLWPMV